MRYMIFVFLFLTGCGWIEFDPTRTYASAQGASGDMGSDADMSTPPTPAEAFEAACNDTSDPDRWQLVVEVTEDLYPTAPIECTRPVIIRGNGHTIHGHGLEFLQQSANWSTIENLRLIGPTHYSGLEEEIDPTTATSVGLRIENHGVRMKNVYVTRWDVGIMVWGTYGRGTNANNAILNIGQVYNNNIGIWIEGGDSNAGYFANLETRNNVVHTWDSSFLGNIHLGGVQDGHGVYRRHDSQAAYSTLLGVYIEGDPPATDAFEMVGRNLVVGGSLSIWSTWIERSMQPTVSPHGYSMLGFSSHNRDMRVQIPAHDDAAFSYAHRDEEFYAWHAFRKGPSDQWWLTAYLNSGYHYPLWWKGKHTNGYVGEPVIRDWENDGLQ